MKIKFEFRNGEEIVIDELVNFKEEKDYYIFSIDNNVFKIKFKSSFHFIKETTNDIFEIISDEETKQLAKYTLKQENLTVYLNMIDFECKKMNEKYIIKYNIESDSEDDTFNTKTIIISFV